MLNSLPLNNFNVLIVFKQSNIIDISVAMCIFQLIDSIMNFPFWINA